MECVQYPGDLRASEGVTVLPRRFATHHHILHLKAFEQSADIPVEETGYRYFSVHNQIQPFFLPNELVSAMLLQSGPCLSDIPDKHCSFSMNAEAKVTATVFNHDFPIKVLLDSGATKMLINERWMNEFDKIHKLPRYHIPSRYVHVGNGQKHHTTHAAKVTIMFEGKPIEIIALIMPGMDDPLDLVIGSKSLFELEANLNYQRVRVKICDCMIPLKTMEKVVLHAHEETIVPISMERIPMHWTESLAIAKLFFPQLMQHCVNHLTAQVHCDVQGHTILALCNGTSESITLPKHTHVGVLNLRTVGYFHKSCDELVRMFSEDYTFLSDKETLDKMYQFCDNLRNFKPSTPDGKDPYPWLPKDDPRCFKSDATLMEETIDLSESILNEHQKKQF